MADEAIDGHFSDRDFSGILIAKRWESVRRQTRSKAYSKPSLDQ
jgi:hypothetical protein